MDEQLSITVPGKKERGGPMDSRVRIGMDIGMIIFVVGMAFNAGATYNNVVEMKESQKADHQSIEQLKRDEQPLSERVARMEAILQDIRDELRQQNERHTP